MRPFAAESHQVAGQSRIPGCAVEYRNRRIAYALAGLNWFIAARNIAPPGNPGLVLANLAPGPKQSIAPAGNRSQQIPIRAQRVPKR
jgi:hypothetical protein